MKQKLPYIITAGAIAAMFLVVFVVCFGMMGSTMEKIAGAFSQQQPSSQSSGVLSLDPNAKYITTSYYFGGGSSDSIAVPGFERLVMKAGQKQQDVLLFNPENNKCFFVIEILTADGTSLFKSGLIEPGKALYSIEISQTLEAGSYDAVLRYSCYAEGTLAELNGAETSLKLEVS